MLETFIEDASQRIEIMKSRLRAKAKSGCKICKDTLWIMGADLNINMLHFSDRALSIARIFGSIGLEVLTFKDPCEATYAHAEVGGLQSDHCID